MILRKPYAILIKNFKLIHFIMAIFMGYLFFKTNAILGFFKDYLSSVATTINSEITTSLFTPSIIVSIFIVIIACIIIMILLLFKQKPIKFYLYNILTCILLSIYYYITFSVVKSLETGLVDVQTLKLLHDFAFMALIIQGLGLIFVLFRATGFDIKSFNFKKDLEDLNIETEDNEEFEVEMEIDSDKLKRNFNKKIRHLKYIYIENKIFINIFAGIFMVVIALLLYFNVNVYSQKIKLNKTISTNYFSLNFTDSYVTGYNNNGTIIKNGYQLVIIRFRAKSLYGERNIGIGSFYLNVNGYKYYHTLNYKDVTYDFGQTFNDQLITHDNYDTYILTYEIPDSKIANDMTLKFTDVNHKVIDIDVTPNNLNKKIEVGTYNLSQEISFDKSILNNSKMIINSYEISPSFKLDYNYCTNNNCINSYEYLKPSTSNNATKLLKLTGSFTLDNDLSTTKLNNLYKFIKSFGKIKYEVNGEVKTMNIDIKDVKPKRATTADTFIEINDEVANASKIYFEFNIRNKIYIYNVK